MVRSFLFVPADDERKLAKAADAGAGALILDLEDAIHADRKELARKAVAAYLTDREKSAGPPVWVRINALETDDALRDLRTVVPSGPAGIVLPKARSPAQVKQLSHYLDELEAGSGRAPGQMGIIPIVTETADAVFQLGAYAQDLLLPRLRGLTWGAEDLGVVIGATARRDERGNWLPVFQQVQSMVLLAAAAAGVQAIDTIYAEYADLEGLSTCARHARQQGFTGMLAIHPTQITVINDEFSPTPAEIDHARRVVEAFEQSSSTGVVTLDGTMLDRPHLAQARRLLESMNQLPR